MDMDFINYFNSLFGEVNKSESNLIPQYEEELNNLYWRDKDRYLRRLSLIKISYRVFRNEKGKHKLQERK